MPYRVLIKRKAQKQLDKIRQEDRERIIGAVYSDSATNLDHGEARGYRAVPDIASESATTGRSTS
jgi:mRNA-degrading endonuclease RelE of RelBE toxin-antitoxin system